MAIRYIKRLSGVCPGESWVKLRVKKAAPDLYETLYRSACDQAHEAGVILGWPEAGPADETLTGAARRVVAERDALRVRVDAGHDVDGMLAELGINRVLTELATVISERDALKSKLGDTENKLATMSLTLQGVESFRVTALEAAGELRVQIENQSEWVMCAWRERDTANARAKAAEKALGEADARLHDALVARAEVPLADPYATHKRINLDLIRERNEASARATNAETALGNATAKTEAMRLCAAGWEAQSNRNMNQCGELTRRAEAAEKAFLDVADEFGLHIRAIAAEKALGQLAEMTRERGECLVKYSKMSQSILDHEAGMSSSIACVAEARAEAAESRLAQVAALVGAGK